MHGQNLAELSRLLVERESVGTLSTWSHKHPGFPFGSVMPYAVDAGGRLVFLISSLAVHAKNLNADARASLLVVEAAPPEAALVAARTTVLGEVKVVDGTPVREDYLGRHPDAVQWVDFGDFTFYCMEVRATYYVGGFGVMGWV